MGLLVAIAFIAVIYGCWWTLIKDTPQKKALEMGLSFVGAGAFCFVLGGLVLGLSYWIMVDIDHLPFRF